MNWVDYTILAILMISALISVLRGFVREALSLLGWIVAFWVAVTYSAPLEAYLVPYINVPSVRQAAAFVALFVGVLLTTAVLMYLVGLLVKKTEITGTDRMLGMFFGLARGAVLVGLLVLLAGLTAVPGDPWWKESMLLPHFERLAVEIKSLMPPEVADHFNY